VTGHCLDSGGDASSVKLRAYTYQDCGNPSGNLRWLFDGTSNQIRNVATGYCLDSGGDHSSVKVPAWTYQNCGHPPGNLRWTSDTTAKQIRNIATGYCLDSGGETAIKALVYAEAERKHTRITPARSPEHQLPGISRPSSSPPRHG
jgi:putative hemolysin